jgi:hypothetical protein
VTVASCFDRKPEFVNRAVVEPIWIPESKYKRRSKLYTLVDPSSFQRGVDSSPLMQCGWVFQERLLAPRVLHFGSSQIFWECITLRASETHREGTPLLGINHIKNWTSITSYFSPGGLSKIYEWDKLIEQYSKTASQQSATGLSQSRAWQSGTLFYSVNLLTAI